MLHQAPAGEGTHAAQLIIPEAVDPADDRTSPEALAQVLWELHTRRQGSRTFAVPRGS